MKLSASPSYMADLMQPKRHENGDGTGHSHEHTHEGGLTHSHEHTHEGGLDHDHTHSNAHGHTHSHENKKAVTNRMARIIGHMNSVKKMVEDDRDCSEVLIQLSAINSAVQSVSRVILKEHLSTCIVDAVKEGDYDAISELNEAIDKFMK